MLAKLSLETLASLPTLTAGSYWVGASDSEVEGQWRWGDASSVTANVWSSGEPNNGGGNEDCATVYSNSKKMNDAPCSRQYGYICQSLSATTCTDCETGKYGPGIGSTMCTDCAAGKYTAISSSTVCTDCSAGKYSRGVLSVSSLLCKRERERERECVCVCVCTHICKRENERERKRVCVCVCVHVCVRERESQRVRESVCTHICLRVCVCVCGRYAHIHLKERVQRDYVHICARERERESLSHLLLRLFQ